MAFAISIRSLEAMPYWDSRSVPHMKTIRVTTSLLLPLIFVYLARALVTTSSSRSPVLLSEDQVEEEAVFAVASSRDRP